MHELGIVFHTIRTIENVAEEKGLTRVGSVTLELGEVSGAIPQELVSCWDWAVNRTELLDSIERVSLMARESKKNHVKFSFEDGQVTITANSEIGASKEIVNIDRMGSDIDIAFNAKYFSDVLKVLDDEYVCLDMNTNISPCVVKPETGDEYYYLILPVRLFSGN